MPDPPPMFSHDVARIQAVLAGLGCHPNVATLGSSGQITAAETWGEGELAITRAGPTV
jgi:altronate dehydratase